MTRYWIGALVTVALVAAAFAQGLGFLAMLGVPLFAWYMSRIIVHGGFGLWSYATDAEAGDRHVDADLADGAIIVIGSEGRGVRPRVRAVCDGAVRIPIQGPVGSLNASVAAAVLLFEARRQRGF